MQVQNLVFPAPGQYEFQIIANGDFLATKAFRVKQAAQAGGSGSAPERPND